MAGPQTRNLKMVKGDSYNAQLQIKVNDVPQDITGDTVTFTLKKNLNADDSEATFQQVITVHTDPTQGITTLQIPKTESSAFTVRDYYYDIQWTQASGENTTILRGTMEVSWEVTDTN